MKEKKIRSPFYGWVVVGAGFVVMAAAMGIVYNCASLFIKPICDTFGYSRQSVNMISSITSVGIMFASLFAGKIFNEQNVITVMRICTVTMSVSFFCYSFANKLSTFYLITVVVSVSQALVTVLPISFIINNWFYEKRGFAMGVASMGSGVGGMIFNSLTGVLITTIGWRHAYQVLGISVFLLVMPCAVFLLKLHPEDMGLAPYGARQDTPPVSEIGPEMHEVVRRPVFWTMGFCTIVIGACMGMLFQSVAPHMVETGYSITFSANLVAICMGALAIGKMLLGKMFDRFGVRFTFTLACASVVIGTIGLYFVQFTPCLILIVLGEAFGCSFGAVCYPVAIPAVFGSKSYRSVMGIYSATLALGGIIAPLITGYVFDRFGSYLPAFFVSGIIMVLVTLWQPLMFQSKKDEY